MLQKFPHLVQELQQTGQSETDIEIVQSKTGEPVARAERGGKRLFLNSSYNPQIEADRWVDNLNKNPNSCLILCGLGFLYHLKALSKRSSFKRIVIYEPCREIFLACLHEVDWEQLLTGFNFLLLVGKENKLNADMTVNHLGSDYFSSLEVNMEIAALPAYKELFTNEISEFQTKIKEIYQLIQVNLSTKNFFSEKWAANGFKNLRSMAGSVFIRDFFDQFSNVPAIIVSAGPSLEKNIHLLNHVKEKVLIICAGASIRAMLKHGVRPHILVAMDPGADANRLIYNDLDLHDITLIYSSRFFYEIVEKYSGSKILMKLDVESFPDLLAINWDEEIGTVKGGFSVAHTAFDLAVQLGCNPITLIGQNLAYSENKFYAEGHIYSSGYNSKTLIRKDIYGQDVVTNQIFDSFRLVFEELIAGLDSKVKVINATEGGLPIAGAVNRRLADVLSEYCQTDQQISKRIGLLYGQGQPKMEQRMTDLISMVVNLKELIYLGFNRMGELIEELQKLRQLILKGQFNFNKLKTAILEITTAYDAALNRREFEILLKELRESRLFALQLRIKEATTISSGEELDQLLQNYLVFFNETKQYLEYCWNSIQESFPGVTQPAVANYTTTDWLLLEKKIKSKESLGEINKTLGLLIAKSRNFYELGKCFYLQGLISIQMNRLSKAISKLEQAIVLDNKLGQAYFALFKIAQSENDLASADEYLEKCYRVNYRAVYCLGQRIKSQYLIQNHVAVNNLINEHQEKTKPKKFFDILRLESFIYLGLWTEAEKKYQSMCQNNQVKNSTVNRIQKLFAQKTINQYEEMYEANRAFFKAQGIIYPDYTEIKCYALCFSNINLFYNSVTGIIKPVFISKNCNLKLEPKDVLIIYNTDNVDIFQWLIELKTCGNLNFDKIIIYILSYNPNYWYLLSQLFDFKQFSGWPRVRFYIETSNEMLEQKLLADALHMPNVFYGRNLERLEQLLSKVAARNILSNLSFPASKL